MLGKDKGRKLTSKGRPGKERTEEKKRLRKGKNTEKERVKLRRKVMLGKQKGTNEQEKRKGKQQERRGEREEMEMKANTKSEGGMKRSL